MKNYLTTLTLIAVLITGVMGCQKQGGNFGLNLDSVSYEGRRIIQLGKNKVVNMFRAGERMFSSSSSQPAVDIKSFKPLATSGQTVEAQNAAAQERFDMADAVKE